MLAPPTKGSRLILHIGSTKTGSTSLQNFLHSNRESLLAEGVLFPNAGFRVLDDDRVPSSGHSNLFYQQGAFDDLVDEIRENTSDTVLLSTEIISLIVSGHAAQYTEKLKEILGLFSEIQVVVYLRRQDHWAESQYLDSVTNIWEPVTLGIDEYVSTQKSLELDYKLFLSKVKEVTACNDILVRLYGEVGFGKGIIPDFMESLSITNYTDWKPAPDSKSNFSYGDHVFKQALLLNRLPFPSKKYAEFMTRWLPSRATRHSKVLRLSLDSRNRLLKKYDLSNSFVARTYLNRADGVLFDSGVQSSADGLDLPTAPASLALAEGAVDAIAAIMLDSQKELGALNEKYLDLANIQVPAYKSEKVKLQGEKVKLQGEKVKLQGEISIAEQRLIKTRGSFAFQLGYQIVSSAKSVRGIAGLPVNLLKLYWKFKKKRRGRGTRQVSEKEPMPPVEHQTFRLTEQQLTGHSDSIKLLCEDSDVIAIEGATDSSALKVACVMDEFTFKSFEPECCLLPLTPSSWESELREFNPALLFIESAWHGNGGEWSGKIGHSSLELQQLIRWCRDNSIPTIFWNKEDPVHYSTFLSTAKLFDHVFTTDIDCIAQYKSALGHERVYLLPFACQPVSHNPIEIFKRKDAICFAGAYYLRYPERTANLSDFVFALSDVKPIEIYDRNYGKDNPIYQFPEEYNRYIVGTLPFSEIEQAYKGYRYAINLNSIKQSQTMFARRVFELIASNTLTISNFSRGLRLMFGDLVITSDDGTQVAASLIQADANEGYSAKLRLAALRKVMLEHTYKHRLNYIRSVVPGLSPSENDLPKILVVAKALCTAEADRIVAQFQAQTYENKMLVLQLPSQEGFVDDDKMLFFTKQSLSNKTIGDVMSGHTWLASLSPDDYYGPNYLLDIAVASQYSSPDLVGKSRYFAAQGSTVESLGDDYTYQVVSELPVRQSSVVIDSVVRGTGIEEWLATVDEGSIKRKRGLSIDQFNYCRNGSVCNIANMRDCVDDLKGINLGSSIDLLQSTAESIGASDKQAAPESISAKSLHGLFDGHYSKNVKLDFSGEKFSISSSLPDGKHEYVYADEDMLPGELVASNVFKCFFDCTPGLSISIVVLLLDEHKQRITHDIIAAHSNGSFEVPPETEWVRLGLRVLASGSTEVKQMILGHSKHQLSQIIGKSDTLVLTNHYPSYSDLYRNAFVHSRVKAYSDEGVAVDIFRLRTNEPLTFDEFDGADVMTGDCEALNTLLSSGQYKNVLVHFLDPDMWSVLKQHIDRLKVIVWVHGAEIQPMHRREYNYTTDEERALAKIQSDRRMEFWRGLLSCMPSNLELVFVSKHLADEAKQDIKINIPQDKINIIHNPINVDFFSCGKKPPEQRKKVLSIRPYASATYANDLTISAILLLSKSVAFQHLEFLLIGDGKLFEETVAPVRKFKNVIVERKFLTHSEIAKLYQQYGVFMCPTRMDSQGVSRDEAMSAGLVPITNAVAAIPEFVDDSCGILAPGEDARAMADGLLSLYNNPDEFLRMSAAAAERVRQQSAQSIIIQKELALFHNK
jgi:glycosyltransferase involved in cell wall biosynthesis/spore maturation protein CgeB